jgi:hypothetical protein
MRRAGEIYICYLFGTLTPDCHRLPSQRLSHRCNDAHSELDRIQRGRVLCDFFLTSQGLSYNT